MSVRLLHGDCREVLKGLEPESVQCVCSSPPYFSLRSYLPDGHPDKAKEIGAETSVAEYVQALVEVFREVRRVLHPTGCAWLNLGDSYASDTKGSGGTGKSSGLRKDGRDEQSRLRSADLSIAHQRFEPRRVSHGLKPKDLLMIPARVAIALQEDGWYLRADCIWAKQNPMPESVRDRPTSAHEHVFLLTRSANYFYDAEAVAERAASRLQARLTGTAEQPKGAARAAAGVQNPLCQGGTSDTRNLRNVWSIASESCSLAHFAVMPSALAEICIKAGTSEKGCCPACQAPWVRVTERVPVDHGMGLASCDHQKLSQMPDRQPKRLRTPTGQSLAKTAPRHLGWQPSCSCPDAGDPVPCTVLDVFAGAGTSLLVADRLQRHAIGIELSSAFCDLIRSRLTADAPLLADVEAA